MTTTAEKIEALRWGIEALESKIADAVDENELLVFLGVGIAQKHIRALPEMKKELEAGL